MVLTRGKCLVSVSYHEPRNRGARDLVVPGAWSWLWQACGRSSEGTGGLGRERTRHGLVTEEGDSSVGRRQAGGAVLGAQAGTRGRSPGCVSSAQRSGAWSAGGCAASRNWL